MYLITYPDYLEKDINIVLHNISDDYKKILLPILFDNLSEEAIIVVNQDHLDWAKQFQNSYWLLQDNIVDFIPSSRQFNITSIDDIPEHCMELFSKINI